MLIDNVQIREIHTFCNSLLQFIIDDANDIFNDVSIVDENREYVDLIRDKYNCALNVLNERMGVRRGY